MSFFAGFGEEMFYRGYVQGRLNEVFGRPYRFFEVPIGRPPDPSPKRRQIL